jgi:hypothetical protein
MIRLKIRQDFEKNRDITDLPIIDMLLHKNQQEYQETMNCWKQEVCFHWRRNGGKLTISPISYIGSRAMKTHQHLRHSLKNSMRAGMTPSRSLLSKWICGIVGPGRTDMYA